MTANPVSTPFSLIWPEKQSEPDRPDFMLPVRTIQDLGLDKLIVNVTRNIVERNAFEHVLLNLSVDPNVIRYRQEILGDLLDNPQLASQLGELLPTIEGLSAHYHQRGILYESSNLYEVTWRLGELESIVHCVHRLQEILDPKQNNLKAQGWERLYSTVQKIAVDPTFQEMEQELPDLLARVRQTKSVTIGINLDHNLLPTQATLLSINRKNFSGVGFLSKLFPKGENGGETRGIAPLHDLLANAGSRSPTSLLSPYGPQGSSPLMAPLFRDLGDVLNKVAKSISNALKEYKRLHGRLFADLWSELLFYLIAVQLIRKLERSGLAMCRPEILAKRERNSSVRDHFNLNLALHLTVGHENIDLSKKVVTHDFALDDEGRIQILTGPNGGGKTTYLQAVGLTHLLAQAGLYIPGSSGQISIVDHLLTHFPVEEDLEKGTGRFGEEAQRLKELFEQITPSSLLLLNESLSSTNPGESLYLAKDLVRLLRQIGVRAIFATHMHELADSAPALNAASDGPSKVVSVVASRQNQPADEMKFVPRSYKIAPGPPIGHSYARQLAARFGIGYRQLHDQLRERGIIP